MRQKPMHLQSFSTVTRASRRQCTVSTTAMHAPSTVDTGCAVTLRRAHYHLLVEIDDGVLPAAMHSLNHGYACTFNRRHGLRGHVQSSRYGSRRGWRDVKRSVWGARR